MKRRVICVLLVLFLCSGCKSFYYHQAMPEIDLPDKPALTNISGGAMACLAPETRQAIVGNFDLLIRYTKQLEVVATEYSAFAVESNAKIGKKDK